MNFNFENALSAPVIVRRIVNIISKASFMLGNAFIFQKMMKYFYKLNEQLVLHTSHNHSNICKS